MPRSGTWDLELDGDFRLADGWELVSLLRQQSDGTYADPVAPVYAVRESLNRRSVAGQMEAADLVFHLDAVGGTAPDGTTVVGVGDDGVRPGDRVRAANDVEYNVTAPTLEGAEDQWRCPCTRVPA